MLTLTLAKRHDLRADAAAAVHLLTPTFVSCLWHKRATPVAAVDECITLVHSVDELQKLARDPASVASGLAFGAFLVLFFVVARKYKGLGWYLCLQVVVLLQWIVALYQVARIALSMSAYWTIKATKLTVHTTHRVHGWLQSARSTDKRAKALKRRMAQCTTYAEWKPLAAQVDSLSGGDAWKTEWDAKDAEECDLRQLLQNVHELQQAIDARDFAALKYLVSAFVTRNKLGMDTPTLHLELQTGSKAVLEQYNALVLQALALLGDAPSDSFADADKTVFFTKLKQSFGSTALCLSGGGAIAMYHMGVLKALLDADLMPNVVSGSSGGSIAAAMCACKTNAELVRDILQDNISTRFIAPLGIRWFPPLLQQLAHCVKTGFLVKCSSFERTTQHYYAEPFGDSVPKSMHYTFQDAFLKTGRHVCITVSASDITGYKGGPKKLLLNHGNTPHVLLWSAVAVSCSLPGIMKGKQLMARDHHGRVVPYVSLGREWIDGSIQHDLPMETMAACFNVTNFIVSQVNPHVVPFIGNEIDRPQLRRSAFHTLESVVAADVRHRLKMLAFLGLFPRIYGHQFSSYFRQNFVGNVTIIPKFIFSESIGIKAILNPTVDDMQRYLVGGQRAVWPKLAFVRHLCCIERALDAQLGARLGPQAVSGSPWCRPRVAVAPTTTEMR